MQGPISTDSMSEGAVRVALVMCCAGLIGCGRRTDVPAFTMRDSAGVVIVESTRPAWNDRTTWRLAPDPSLRIGAVEGEPGYELSDVTGVVRAADGRIVVADGGSQEVRFFRPDGTLLERLGGRGEGPGEFIGLSGVGRGSTGMIWAYDFTLRRISWLTAAGSLVRVTTLGPEPPVLSPVGALPDGSFVLKQLWGAQQAAGAIRPGLRRDPVAYVRFDPNGRLVDTVGLFPGREIVLTEEGGRGVMSSAPFGRTSVAAVRDGLLLVGSETRFEVEERAADGPLIRVFGIPGRDLRLRDEDVRRYAQERLAAAPPDRRREVERDLEDAAYPELRPAYGDLIVDAEGNLWVGAWALAVPETWTVFGGDGAWLGDVRMPPGFYPRDIGDTWVIGIVRDALDVEQVVMYPLVKPG